MLEVLAVATRLGLTSFGGPVAHLGYFRDEYVVRRQWLDEVSYADLVALCQFLPGPASSKVGIAIGILRAGLPGGVAAWLGFTLPSALLLAAFAYSAALLGETSNAGWLHGLKIAAVAVVALAVWGMARTLCPDKERASLAIGAAVLALNLPGLPGQLIPIVVGGLIGWRFLGGSASALPVPLALRVGRTLAIACWVLLFGLLVALPLTRQVSSSPALALFDSFFRTGSLVFGGGHVVLPLLHAEVVAPGWVTEERFVAGYGAAQAVPGPLFTFSAYLGAVMDGAAGATIALVAIFLPGFLMTIGSLPFWETLRSRGGFQAALVGVNAAVVGLLLAALYHPVWTSAIRGAADVAFALVAFGLLAMWKWPPWLVVVLAAAGAQVLA